jgi:aqualysin 1
VDGKHCQCIVLENDSMRKVFVSLVTLGTAVAAFTGISTRLSAQATSSMIVVLNENVPFAQYRSQFMADDRFSSHSVAWNYLNRDVVGTVQTWERQLNFRAHAIYSAAVKGFAAQLTSEQVTRLKQSGWVKSVEPDQIMKGNAQAIPWGIDRVEADISSTKAGDGGGAVANVNVYIIDSGIAAHPDLNLVNQVKFQSNPRAPVSDCNGHGTHVAGTASAIDDSEYVVGAAPGAKLTAVKVLNCSFAGLASNVIQGIDWVTANAQKPAVANMSLGGGVSDAVDEAVRKSAATGIVYAIAAGNGSQDACNVSPARAGAGSSNGIITVGATDINNQEASFSNFGNCVDIWAPGVDITSTWLNSSTNNLSGTSMASPHVAGVAGLYLSSNPNATPANVEAQLRANAVFPGTTSKDGRAIQLINAAKY